MTKKISKMTTEEMVAELKQLISKVGMWHDALSGFGCGDLDDLAFGYKPGVAASKLHGLVKRLGKLASESRVDLDIQLLYQGLGARDTARLMSSIE